MRLVLITLMVAALGCASKSEGAEPVQAEAAEPTSGAEPSDVPAEPIPSTNEGSEAPGSDAPSGGGGRMAFTQCPEGERPQACTREYRPVCAEVDNGVRCVTTPCDSTDQKEFANGCTACAEPKTTGYWPVACAELGNDAK